MWTCPKCDRKFRKKNQAHGCHQMPEEALFIRRSEKIRELYTLMKKEVSKFGEYRVECVPPDVAMLKTKSTFMALKVKTKWLDIEFFLDYHEAADIIKKSLQTSKKRWIYIVSIDSPEEINQQLLNWCEYSYNLIKNA